MLKVQSSYNQHNIFFRQSISNGPVKQSGTLVPPNKDNGSKYTEQQQKYIRNWLVGMLLASAVIGGAVGIYRDKIKHLFKKVFKGDESLIFVSLKNNPKVLALDDCKSLNKDLKKMLEHQIKLANADKNILEEVGKPDAANRFLLSGPPGVGKTYFSKIYAKTLDAEYAEVLFSDLNSKWVGEVEEKMAAAFNAIISKARQNPKKKYVVTFNEIDSMLLPVEYLNGRSGGSTFFANLRRERSTFLTYIDKLLDEASNVTVIGTTNLSPKSKNLDGATMSRFQNTIEIPYPDKDCLFEAIKINLEKIKGSNDFILNNEDKLKSLAGNMAERKYSFRNLEYVINEAKSGYLEAKLDNKNAKFKFEYLENAHKSLKKTDGERGAADTIKEI